MTATPRNVNLVLLRNDGHRRTAGSVIVRGAATWMKTMCDAGYLHRNRNALGLNVAVIDQLNEWRVKDVYFLLGSCQGKTRYRTTVAAMERLGSSSNAGDGWGMNLLLPVEQWTQDRSTFDLGWVPTGQDLVLPVVSVSESLPVLAPRERVSRPGAPAQLGLFDVRVA